MFLSCILWSCNVCIANINKQYKRPKKWDRNWFIYDRHANIQTVSTFHGSFFWFWCSDFVFFSHFMIWLTMSVQGTANSVVIKYVKVFSQLTIRVSVSSFLSVLFSLTSSFSLFCFVLFFFISCARCCYLTVWHYIVVYTFIFIESNAMWNVCVHRHTELWIGSWNGMARSLCARFDSI